MKPLLRLALPCLAAAWLAACDDGLHVAGPMEPKPPVPACEQDDAAFVREASLALLGRRPLSEVETRAAADLIAGVDELEGDETGQPGRRAWARALMATPAFVERWQELLLDALEVPRSDVQALSDCYDQRLLARDDASLARHLRDHDARDARTKPFTFLDLARSSLILDDLSPLYRAHLFAMLTRPNVCVNVDPVAQELATRREVGNVFDTAYMNRDQVCLACHNSETSVTYHPSPSENRHFAIQANLEKAVFGVSVGVPERVAHAVFRTDGFLASTQGEPALCQDGNPAYCAEDSQVVCEDGSAASCRAGGMASCDDDFVASCPIDAQLPAPITPWGADPGCGSFTLDVEDDPAGVDAKLGSLHGKRATVFQLERALRRGVDALARKGLVVEENGDVEDADSALAYMVAMTIVDRVFREVMGSSLTIATRFPRTQAAHDLLLSLTENFVAEHFSLQTLLLDILATRAFNALPPEAGCGEPYALPALLNPWVRDEPEPALRLNSAADGVHPLSARTLLSATHAALDWPLPEGARFPGAGAGDSERPEETDESCFELASCEEAQKTCAEQERCCRLVPLLCEVQASEDPELAFQRSVGVFLSISQKGFRGLDLGARLSWEERFGACKKPEGVTEDALDQLMARGRKQNATLEAFVLALKDRLIGEARLEPGEDELLRALLGAGLDARLTTEHEPALRRLCGALLASPEHLLGGLPARGGEPPHLGPSAAAACRALGDLPLRAYRVSCQESRVTVLHARSDE